MTQIFHSPLHEEFGTWTLGFAPYGGADFGEVEAVAKAVGEGDDKAFFTAWTTFAGRLREQAEAALSKGHRESARELFLRASAFYAASYHPLFGEPVNPLLLDAFSKQVESLDRGLALFEPAVLPARIPFEQSSMPVYLLPAAGREREVRPLVILTNGYDGTITDMYFGSAAAASQRGYHCLLFDGPGQGEMLFEHGIRLRPDWETVIAPVVDFGASQPNVDPARIALNGWSLGGYLAPRAVSGEPRIAALIADPATWGIAEGFRQFIVHKLGVAPEAATDLGNLDEAIIQMLDAIIRKDRDLTWKFVQRGFWVHGVGDLRSYLRSAEQFTMQGRAELIRCPTLLTMAEGDARGAMAPLFFEALQCPKTLLRFSAAEGAGDHCEMHNRSLLNRRTLDWLDEQFSKNA